MCRNEETAVRKICKEAWLIVAAQVESETLKEMWIVKSLCGARQKR
jgi:hypothetical protein